VVVGVLVHNQLGELVLIGLTTRDVGDADLLDRHGCLLGQVSQSIASERGVPGLHAPLCPAGLPGPGPNATAGRALHPCRIAGWMPTRRTERPKTPAAFSTCSPPQPRRLRPWLRWNCLTLGVLCRRGRRRRRMVAGRAWTTSRRTQGRSPGTAGSSPSSRRSTRPVAAKSSGSIGGLLPLEDSSTVEVADSHSILGAE
jgi:hypothetical protein